MNRNLEPDDDEPEPVVESGASAAITPAPVLAREEESGPPPEPPPPITVRTRDPIATYPDGIKAVDVDTPCSSCGRKIVGIDTRSGTAFCAGCGRTKRPPK